jgi:lipopolysaccharide/colanic/teichoic acid biosynthesis glycosyltransferase
VEGVEVTTTRAARQGRTVLAANAGRRALDIGVALTLALLTLPVLLLALVGSAITLRAWPFFAQQRVGIEGEPFRFYKVRTLPPAVPAYTDKFALAHQSIPRFCLLLRALHLDELPQLGLVLAGRMSLVGPRPEMPYLHDGLPPAFAEQRTSIRPGCTGLWQISESSTGLIGSAPEYDRFYLEHRSLRLDLWILVRTALKMTRAARTITLPEVPGWALAGAPSSGADLSVQLPASTGR